MALDRACVVLALLVSGSAALAHPGSGIYVDARGQVHFVDTGSGVWKIDAQGKLARQAGPAFHWMALDADGRFVSTRLPRSAEFEVVAVGRDPTLILSSDFPLTVGRDGALYFPELGGDDRLRVIRLGPSAAREVAATLPQATARPLRWLNGMTTGADNSIYYSENAAVRKITKGAVATVVEKVVVADCATRPGYEDIAPNLRGLDVAADGTVFVAASGCGAVLRITPGGEVTTVLRAESPWSPTGISVFGKAVYVLEYLHTASDDRREWLPRVRKLTPDGKVQVLATVDRPTR